MSLFENQIPLLKPWLDEKEAAEVRKVIFSGWVSQGPKVIEFEKEVSKYVGAKFAVATNSCTSALHLSLIISGVEAGDEVICPAFTCMATADAIIHSGGIPIFADIEPNTFNIDPDHVAELVNERTKAIMAVHQIGLPADIDALQKIARQQGLFIVEDAACTLGAKYKDRYVGGLGNPTCFSFHPRKTITTGEGGMLLTNDEEKAERARILRSHGASISDLVRHKALGCLQHEYVAAGFNYRMTDMQAAIGLVQLKKIEKIIQQRLEQAQYYNEQLTKIEDIKPPFVPKYATHAYTSYLITVESSKVDRDTLLTRLTEKGVSCRRGIQPLYKEPYFHTALGKYELPRTEYAAHNTLFLPIFPGLQKSQQDYIIKSIKDSLKM